MVEPLTVVALAFSTLQTVANSEPGKKFIEEVVGKIAEDFTEAAQEKIAGLRELIARKLQRHSGAAAALREAQETGSEPALRSVSNYVNQAMQQDPEFARQVEQFARDIQQEIAIDKMEGGEVWNVIGNAEKNVFSDNKAPVFKDNSGTVNINYGTPPQNG